MTRLQLIKDKISTALPIIHKKVDEGIDYLAKPYELAQDILEKQTLASWPDKQGFKDLLKERASYVFTGVLLYLPVINLIAMKHLFPGYAGSSEGKISDELKQALRNQDEDQASQISTDDEQQSQGLTIEELNNDGSSRISADGEQLLEELQGNNENKTSQVDQVVEIEIPKHKISKWTNSPSTQKNVICNLTNTTHNYQITQMKGLSQDNGNQHCGFYALFYLQQALSKSDYENKSFKSKTLTQWESAIKYKDHSKGLLTNEIKTLFNKNIHTDEYCAILDKNEKLVLQEAGGYPLNLIILVDGHYTFMRVEKKQSKYHATLVDSKNWDMSQKKYQSRLNKLLKLFDQYLNSSE